ncbi:MAG: chromosome segregation protein SMC [Nanoarchaeota archaeon]|nr:chromosome segregation protein SMC [Nanoarchaeota archaeon]
MAKLERLVLQGFKSFKRKASVPFPSGFSVVTGPNGSGKSNIGDAISFVLGKTSSRLMRAKKSQELIFHGGKKKGGSEYAIVTLYFDNHDNNLPLPEKNPSISRRINQKGVSTYRLNGKVVTRQQIVDIFAQAGIHHDGHNIIQQGDVTQIVEMDAVERREILDEISGIAEYDDKKKKAEKELEKIDDKVKEAEIILNEKVQIIEKLKTDRDAALEYKKAVDNLDKIRNASALKSYDEAEKGLEISSKKIEEKEKQFEALEKEIKELDGKLEKEENALETLTKKVLKASNNIEITKKIERLRSNIEITKDKIISRRSEIGRLHDMIDRIQSLSIGRGASPAIKDLLKMKGVCGTFANLVSVPGDYATAVEIAAGGHMSDVVVDSTGTAVKCVQYLKSNKAGRARFIPLDKIQSFKKGNLPKDAIGWLSDLVEYSPRYSAAIKYVLGSTACVKDIEIAKKISSTQRLRMVSLDGDIMEASGAITGGYFKRRLKTTADTTDYVKEKAELEKEIEKLEVVLRSYNKDLEKYADEEVGTETTNFERERVKIDERLKRIREKRNEAYEDRVELQQTIGKLNVQRARWEAKHDGFRVNLEARTKRKEKKDIEKEVEEFMKMPSSKLNEMETNLVERIDLMGPVNMKSIDDFETIKEEFDDFKEKVDKIVTEKNSILETITTIETKRLTTFSATLTEVSKNFKTVYRELTGGEADLELEGENDMNTGLLIKASPGGKKLLNIDSLSGGEKTLTAFAFLFAIQRHKPSPFYILDEADAALDEMNTRKIVDLIKKQSKLAQFIVISHNDTLVREGDQIYGVTMDDGESKILSIELPKDLRGKAN